MHNNHYFLRHLVPELGNKLSRAILNRCYSQNKDELIIEFRLKNSNLFYIKAYLKSDFSSLSFPNNFYRAKRNSANLFNSIINQQITGFHLFNNERAFILKFNNNNQLLFKLYGNKSNILLIRENQVIELFKNSLINDKNLDITQLDRELDITFEHLKAEHWKVRKVIPTLDKLSAQHLKSILENQTPEQKRLAFNTFMQEISNPPFYIIADSNGFKLSLINTNDNSESYTDPILAITLFFERQVKFKTLNNFKSTLISEVNSQILKANNYLNKVKKRLAELSNDATNQLKADILMANLTNINKRSKSVDLLNFYTEKLITIKLNPLLSPQKNAERFYRKSKNEAIEVAILKKNISNKEELLYSLNNKLKELKATNSIKDLKVGQPKHQKNSPEIILPFKEFNIDGYKILVGKNAKKNDELTLKVAKKDDLWLHAKDVAGSHVVISRSLLTL